MQYLEFQDGHGHTLQFRTIAPPITLQRTAYCKLQIALFALQCLVFAFADNQTLPPENSNGTEIMLP